MAVPEQTPYIEYDGNGVSKVFPLTFDCEDSDHLIVKVNDEMPVVGAWSLVDEKVVFINAPVIDSKIVIQRNTPTKRSTTYKSYDNSFRPAPVDSDFDTIWRKLQELGVTNWLTDTDIKNLGIYVNSLNDETRDDFFNSLGNLEKNTNAMLEEAIANGAVSALAITTVDSISDLDSISTWDGRTVYVKGVANFKYDDSISEWVLVGNLAESIVDSSGSNQDEFNTLVRSESLNILKFYSEVNDLGLAIEIAHAQLTNKLRTIFIPDNTYSVKTTANLTLTDSTALVFGTNVKINVDNAVDVFDINFGNHTLNISGNGASLYPNWPIEADASNVSVFKFLSTTLGKSLRFSNFNVYKKDDLIFAKGIDAVGLNYSIIKDSVIQAKDCLTNSSENSDEQAHAMGNQVNDCFLHADDTAVTLINEGQLACEGFNFKGGEYFGKTGIKVLDQLDNTAYYPPLLRTTGVHMNCERFFSIEGISRVDINACDLQSRVVADSEFTGLIEISGVQGFTLSGGTTITQAETTGTAPNDSLPVLSIKKNNRGRITAFTEIGYILPWLTQTAPLVHFENDAEVAGKVKVANISTTAFTSSYITNDFTKVIVSSDMILTNALVRDGFNFSTSATFNSLTGELDLNVAPSSGSLYQITRAIVPDGSIIKKIKVQGHIGKEFKVVIEGFNVKLEHGMTLITPTGETTHLIYGGSISLFSYNSDACRITGISEGTSMIATQVPSATSAPGWHGQMIYSAGNIYIFVYGAGWLKVGASAF
ncbi:hypothetical protein B9T36_10815 [Acinetobacter sp. ANC 4204]|uniref:hypothetical protein n=1 Tax=Acinetobacter sp. ANC 4204 TaxID=1977884 RepID=UPI000A32B9A4|nr:hypothetical protein [Acinetobacter sp. ANC 4204]OTG58821.1 hypothetical protein B9T36_10815 [Acinetobacter sp. ANC 4204]